MRSPSFRIKTRLSRNGLRCFGFCFISVCFLVSGCSLSAHRVHPEFESRIKGIKRAVMVPPDVSMLELLPSGLIRPREDWSAKSHQSLQNAVQHYLKGQQCWLQPPARDPDIAREIEEIQVLYRLVQKSMWQRTFKSQNGSESAPYIDFSLGSIDALLGKLQADGLIFVSGYQRVSAAGRKTLIKLTITDSSGSILYYSVRGSIRGNDLMDPAGADKIVHELFSGFSRTN